MKSEQLYIGLVVIWEKQYYVRPAPNMGVFSPTNCGFIERIGYILRGKFAQEQFFIGDSRVWDTHIFQFSTLHIRRWIMKKMWKIRWRKTKLKKISSLVHVCWLYTYKDIWHFMTFSVVKMETFMFVLRNISLVYGFAWITYQIIESLKWNENEEETCN